MNQILKLNADDQDVRVQAGVTRYQLNDHLDAVADRLMFSVDPGADASLGGMAATSASGSSAVRYGTMRENVMGLTVVLADGRIVRTGGRARKSSAGYDLTHLFVGSEGTLGIIAELTLKLHRKPVAISSAVCGFGDIDTAVRAVIEVLNHGIVMARIELLDDVQIAAVNAYSQLAYAVQPTLFFEFHGSDSSVQEQAQAVGRIINRVGGTDFHWAENQDDRERLWQARYDAYYASLALRPGGVGYVTDVCVPISQLANCIRKAKTYLAGTTVPCPLFGHVGDGNYHVVFVIDPESASELREVSSIHERIVEDALAAGGTCSGEHGIGIGKLDALRREHPTGIEVMRAIKSALDPHGLMNPGKVVSQSAT